MLPNHSPGHCQSKEKSDLRSLFLVILAKMKICPEIKPPLTKVMDLSTPTPFDLLILDRASANCFVRLVFHVQKLTFQV